jgi:hypothetical protein
MSSCWLINPPENTSKCERFHYENTFTHSITGPCREALPFGTGVTSSNWTNRKLNPMQVAMRLCIYAEMLRSNFMCEREGHDLWIKGTYATCWPPQWVRRHYGPRASWKVTTECIFFCNHAEKQGLSIFVGVYIYLFLSFTNCVVFTILIYQGCPHLPITAAAYDSVTAKRRDGRLAIMPTRQIVLCLIHLQ